MYGRLSAAACVLLASGAGSAGADPGPKWQFDGSGLAYAELSRANVIEPTARITRFFSDGQTLSAMLGFDVVTGASPTGAVTTTTVQTITTPSGNVKTQSKGTVPTSQFTDARGVLDLGWTKPYGGWLTTSLGGHVSVEKDYRSLGGDAKVSIAMMRRLTTVTLGGGYDDDVVDPTGGTRVPLSDGTVLLGTGPNPKRVSRGLVGLSRVLTRRWMAALTASRTYERGYLTEPYKIVSLVDPQTEKPVGQVTEGRPSTRDRRDMLLSSVYHFETDMLYLSDRYYWDDWGIRSNTVDCRLRHDLERGGYLEPHLRYYLQTHAGFFHDDLVQGAPLPDYASADYRLGDLQTLTLGATYGFRPAHSPGEFTIRGEYMRQWGNAHPTETDEIEQMTDLSPPVHIGSLAVAYSVQF